MLKFLRNSTWEEIFQVWKTHEGSDPAWIKFAREVKGWPDWETWRRHSVEKIQPEKRNWDIFEITDLESDIPTMLLGPYEGWQKFFASKNTASFEDLLKNPEAYEFFSKHEKILALFDNFPVNSQFIGLKREDSGKIVLIEGHHRAAAIVIARKNGVNISLPKSNTIAIALLAVSEIELLDKILSAKNSM